MLSAFAGLDCAPYELHIVGGAVTKQEKTIFGKVAASVQSCECNMARCLFTRRSI